MGYLRLRRKRATLACFAAFSSLFLAFPHIDIYVSGMFFDKSFYMSQQRWTAFTHENLGYFLGLSMASVVGLYVWNRLLKRNLCGIDGKRVVYLLLVLIVGAGLIVNVVLKDNFGRARPRDIVEFGGSKLYTPPFVVSHECDKNCSFSSVEAAGGFFALALALALSKRRALFVSGIGLGVFVSFCRIAAGAHFLSDTVVSFFVMLIVADVLYYYAVLTDIERQAARSMVPQKLEERRATIGSGVDIGERPRPIETAPPS